MKLRIKISPSSGERDKVFSTTYGDVKYTVGPETVDVPEEAGRYIARSFSGIVEIVPEPARKATSEEDGTAVPMVTKRAKKKKQKVK